MDASILAQAAERYGVSPGQFKPVSGGNFSAVYEFPYRGSACILRITPPNEGIDYPTMRSILDWMGFLAAQGAPVTRPLPSPRGSSVECIPSGEVYLAAAFEKAAGVLGEALPFEQWTPALFQALGRAAGRLHAAARRYTPPAELRPLPGWDQGGSYFHPAGCGGAAQAAVLRAQAQALEHICGLPRCADCYGLIHADFHGGNFFVDPARQVVTVFDFDDCCYGWYAMDTAVILFDMLVLYPGRDKEVFALRFLRSYLEGYRAVSALDAFWLAQVPHFLKLLETSIYLDVLPLYDPCDRGSWVGRFMQGRRRRIEHGAPYVDIHFETL